MKKKPLRLTISFGKGYENVFYYLNVQENISKFICEMVQKEMKSDRKRDDLEDKVHEVLLKIISNENLSLNFDKLSKKSSLANSLLKDEEVDLLNDLFG